MPAQNAVRPSALDSALAAQLKRDASGLFCAVAQQYDTGEVLMVGWMDDEALHRTLTTGRCTYWSRSRGEYWVKGDTSGHQQWVKSVALDCDGDAVLVKVDQVGAACHTGDRTCFDARVLPATVLDRPVPAAPAPGGAQASAGIVGSAAVASESTKAGSGASAAVAGSAGAAAEPPPGGAGTQAVVGRRPAGTA